MLCGGYDKQTPTRKCWIYDHNLSNWAQIGDMPYARADHAMVKIDDKVFFIGGVGESNEKVMSYDLSLNTWNTNYAIFQNPLYSSGFGVYDNKIAIVGGIEVSNSKISNRFETFDPSLNLWEKKLIIRSMLLLHQFNKLNKNYMFLGVNHLIQTDRTKIIIHILTEIGLEKNQCLLLDIVCLQFI